MSKIIYQDYTPPAPADPPKPDDQLPPVSYHARAALLIGLFVITAILTIGWAFDLSWRGVLKAALVLGVLSAGAFGVFYTWISTTHKWRMDAAERKRRWKAEDAAQYSYAAASLIPDEPDVEITKSRRLEIVCWQILRMHYIKKMQATRPQCERAGITQPEWNAANRLLQLVGLKGERGWADLAAADAFDRFETCTSFDQESVWYSPTGSRTNQIRFFAENVETETGKPYG